MTDRRTNLKQAEAGEGPITRFDLKVIEAVDPLSDTLPVKALGKASALADQPPLIAASVAVGLFGLATRNPRLLRAGLRMLASHALATGAKKLIKDNVDRPRPHIVEAEGRHQVEPGKNEDGDEQSFPSGHSAGATAVARAVGREYPGSIPAGYTAAALASAIQVPRKAHFPSDVVVGIAIGLASEALVDFLTRKLGLDARPQFAPPED